jgi:hypothetical protein
MFKAIAWLLGPPIERNRAIHTKVCRRNVECRIHPMLFVDEAQDLRNDLLEDLRLLTNYAMDSEPRLCLLLVGPTELRRRLGMAVHELLARRIVVPGVREETTLRYKVNGSAEMTEIHWCEPAAVTAVVARARLSLVRESSATVVSTVMCIPFMRSSRIRRLPWRCRSLTILEQTMAMRKRDDEVFPNAAGIDVGGSSHWVAVPRHARSCE